MKLWTKNSLADELEVDRRRLDRLLSQCEPDGKVAGRYDGFKLATVIPLLNPVISSGEAGHELVDPETLHPKDRDLWYAGEHKRINIEKDLGALIPDEVHRRELSVVLSAVLAPLDTFPDLIERDAAATPEQVIMAEEVVRLIREEMHDQIIQLSKED